MNTHQFTRRTLLAAAGCFSTFPALAEEPAVEQPFPADANEAFARLKEGNARFVEGKTRHAHESANWRKHLIGSQRPFATILGCSDSRVPVELVFDQGFGDLFVIRVAGNVVAPDVVGSVAYALAHLQTPLFVVVGHEGCGAVTAAVHAMQGADDEPRGIRELVKMIQPGLPESLQGDSPEKRITAAIEANVRWSVKQLLQIPGAADAFEERKVMLVGAIYELGTGRIRIL